MTVLVATSGKWEVGYEPSPAIVSETGFVMFHFREAQARCKEAV